MKNNCSNNLAQDAELSTVSTTLPPESPTTIVIDDCTKSGVGEEASNPDVVDGREQLAHNYLPALEQLELIGKQFGDKTICLRAIPPAWLTSGRVQKIEITTKEELESVFSSKTYRDYGLYFVVNDGGHNKESIDGCLAIFFEWDDLPLDEQRVKLQSLQTEGKLPRPTLVVKTSKSLHVFFTLKTPVSRELWEPLQKDLIAFVGSDPACKDASRVMRLAGSVHTKNQDNYVMCEIIESSGVTYDFETLRAMIPKSQPPKTPKPKVVVDNDAEQAAGGKVIEIKYGSVDSYIAAAKSREFQKLCLLTDGRNYELNNAALRLGELGVPYEEAESLLLEACKTNGKLEKDGETACIATIKSGWNAGSRDPVEFKVNQPTEENKGRGGTDNSGGAGGKKVDKTVQLLDIIQQEYAHRLSYNVVTNQIYLDNQPLESLDSLYKQITANHRFSFGFDPMVKFVSEAAKEKKFSPVVRYLEALKWDGKERINYLVEQVIGTDEPLHKTFMRRWFISAVARGLQPGCKVDTVLILKGKQGNCKTSFFEILADAWYSCMDGDASDKDSRMNATSAWVVELAELDFLSRKDLNKIKAFLTQLVDKFRPPYGRLVEKYPRRCVFVGTTNEDEFLTDSTGSRRFWVIQTLKKLDTEWLTANRDQLWAEAVQIFKSGEQWWLTELEEAARIKDNEQYETADPLAEKIRAYAVKALKLSGRDMSNPDNRFATVSEVLDAMEVSITQQTKQLQMRVATALEKSGFSKGNRKRLNGNLIIPWHFPSEAFKDKATVVEPTAESTVIADSTLAAISPDVVEKKPAEATVEAATPVAEPTSEPTLAIEECQPSKGVAGEQPEPTVVEEQQSQDSFKVEWERLLKEVPAWEY